MKSYEPKHGFTARSLWLRSFALRGFSLIELMIVVAIIAVLSAVAVPAYRSYLFKSKISDVIDYAAAASKTANDYIAESGGVVTNTNPLTGNLCTGMPGVGTTNTISTPNTTSWAVATSCIVTAISSTAAGNGVAVTITMTPSGNTDGSISWKCSSGNSPYAPGDCQ